MSTPKMVTHTLEELKEGAALALKVSKLVELVKNAPLNNKDKVNLTWVDKESLSYALDETGSPKTAEELRKSTHSLALMRRDYEKEFEEIVDLCVVQKATEEIVGRTRERFGGIFFRIPHNADLISTQYGHNGTIGHDIRFNGFIFSDAWKFCEDILRKLAESKEFNAELVDEYEHVRDEDRYSRQANRVRVGLAQLVEEKFGMKVIDADNSEEEAASYREPEEGDSFKIGDHILVNDYELPYMKYRPRVLEVITVRETQVAARGFEGDKEPLFSGWFNKAEVRVIPKLL